MAMPVPDQRAKEYQLWSNGNLSRWSQLTNAPSMRASMVVRLGIRLTLDAPDLQFGIKFSHSF